MAKETLKRCLKGSGKMKCAKYGKDIPNQNEKFHYWDVTSEPREVWFCSEKCLEIYNHGT